MARVFVTGSADGLGQLAAKALIADGHKLVLHARNEKRGRDAAAKVPGAETVLMADLSSIDETKELAENVNALGHFDAVIHNAAVYRTSGDEILKVNTLAPYILTCLIERPKRLIYMSSGMHMQGRAKLESFKTDASQITYSDSKLHVVMLCFAVARRWPEVYANVLDPGWVPTKMGGAGAPDSLQKGYETQVWLATSDDEKAKVSGRYFHHLKVTRNNGEADDVALQERFLHVCSEVTGVSLP
jgi:NAD(P)-dependent dehydrogenase (short-subunit alcohol dehydrogenase family)